MSTLMASQKLDVRSTTSVRGATSLPSHSTTSQGGRPPLSAGITAYRAWLDEMCALTRLVATDAGRRYHGRKLEELGDK